MGGAGWGPGERGLGRRAAGGVAGAMSHPMSPPPSSNILLDQALRPRLGDFGLARAGRGRAGSGGLSASLGRTHTVRGTLAYLPPEYVQSGALSPAIDTYSYGVVSTSPRVLPCLRPLH